MLLFCYTLVMWSELERKNQINCGLKVIRPQFEKVFKKNIYIIINQLIWLEAIKSICEFEAQFLEWDLPWYTSKVYIRARKNYSHNVYEHTQLHYFKNAMRSCPPSIQNKDFQTRKVFGASEPLFFFHSLLTVYIRQSIIKICTHIW